MWLAAPIFVSILIFLPETNAQTILLLRAQRLRKVSGNERLVSEAELKQVKLDFREVVVGNLWRPLQINMLDPAVLFTSLYIGLVYGILYSFFEVFPLVYGAGIPRTETAGYGMHAGEQGLVFLSIAVGVIIAITIYSVYIRKVFEPELRAGALGPQERRLIPGLYASFLAPLGLFIFAWTGNTAPRYNWAIPTLGIVLFLIGIFIVFQVVLIYISFTYPPYAASLFAGNGFARAAIAAGAIHFSYPLFGNLGVARGVSLLGGLTVAGVIGIWVLYVYGGWLRSKSRFALK